MTQMTKMSTNRKCQIFVFVALMAVVSIVSIVNNEVGLMESERTEPIRLLEIEKELAGPDKEAALARYDRVLAGLSARIDEAMKAGLPPDEFPKVEELRKANTLARKILRLTVRVDGEARKA